jgi:hypothetical protein
MGRAMQESLNTKPNPDIPTPLEALKYLCGVVEGFPHLLNDPELRPAFTLGQMTIEQEEEIRMGGISLICPSNDCSKQDPRTEDAFRRGYQRAWWDCMMVHREAGWEYSYEHYSKICHWRFNETPLVFVPPPSPEIFDE